MVIPSGQPEPAGTYLVTWNGHGDAMALHRIESTGALTLANSFTYGTWGRPTTAVHNGIADLGFRFTYVGEFDVQWDRELGLDLYYMHARHYNPATGRFIQPDPDRSEANLYAYAANSPVTEIDPDGTCFIVCVIVGAVIDTAVYLATTDSSQWNVGDAAGAVVSGAVESAVNPLAKIGKVTKLANAAQKVYSKFGAGRAVTRVTGNAFARNRASQAGQIWIPGLGRSSKFREAGPNPFRGKSVDEIDVMFKAKGFRLHGPSPSTGRGAYTHPRTGRSYHIDLKRHNRPHVDVLRPRGYKGPLQKHRYGIE